MVSWRKEEAHKEQLSSKKAETSRNTWPTENVGISCINMHQLAKGNNGKCISERKDTLDVENKGGMDKNTVEFKCSLK